MSDIFGVDGQATETLDESVFLDDVEEQPQNEANDIEDEPQPEEGPVEEQTSEANEAAPEDNITETPANTDKVFGIADELAQSRKNYDNLRSYADRVNTENATLKKRLAELEKQSQTPQEPEDKEAAVKERIQKLVDDPDGYITPFLDAKLKPLIEEREQRIEAERMAKTKEDFEGTYKECASCWSQLATDEGRQNMVRQMLELANQRTGDYDSWREDPGRYVFDACRSLWGLPKVNNPEAIEAARKAEREAVMNEMSGRGNKAGLTANQSGNRTNAEMQNKEQEIDPIVEDMLKISGASLF